jgi:DnaJ-class molecular chaperone
MREIRSQYRRLVLLWHPDKNPECGKRCEEKFTSIVAAYEILGQEDKRRVYD